MYPEVFIHNEGAAPRTPGLAASTSALSVYEYESALRGTSRFDFAWVFDANAPNIELGLLSKRSELGCPH